MAQRKKTCRFFAMFSVWHDNNIPMVGEEKEERGPFHSWFSVLIRCQKGSSSLVSGWWRKKTASSPDALLSVSGEYGGEAKPENEPSVCVGGVVIRVGGRKHEQNE